MKINIGDSMKVIKSKEPRWLSRPLKVIGFNGKEAICSYECWDKDPKGSERTSNAIRAKGVFLLEDLTKIL